MATLTGVTSSIGGSEIFQGGVFTTTVAIVGVTVGMVVTVTPRTYPGNGAFWLGYVSAPGVVTVKVGATIAMTPTASIYDVQVNDGASPTSLLFSQTASVTITSGGFQTLVGAGAGSATLPAGFFSAPGKNLHVFASGSLSTPATVAACSYKMTLGGVIVSSGSIALNNMTANQSGTAWSIYLIITARTIGATGRLDASGAGIMGTNAAGPANPAQPWPWGDPGNLVDTTSALAFDLQWNFTGFASGDSITCTNLVLE